MKKKFPILRFIVQIFVWENPTNLSERNSEKNPNNKYLVFVCDMSTYLPTVKISCLENYPKLIKYFTCATIFIHIGTDVRIAFHGVWILVVSPLTT
jgi:hypothetical protein